MYLKARLGPNIYNLVQLETYSAQEDLRARLVSENALIELEDLMNQILARKEEDRPSIPFVSLIHACDYLYSFHVIYIDPLAFACLPESP